MAIARRSSAATKAKTHRAGRRPAGAWAAGPAAPGLTRERDGPGVPTRPHVTTRVRLRTPAGIR